MVSLFYEDVWIFIGIIWIVVMSDLLINNSEHEWFLVFNYWFMMRHKYYEHEHGHLIVLLSVGSLMGSNLLITQV